ncbi:MAG: hypothetical protein GDA68_20470 [Nitrospira sp. CR2.1]|nr:hypothetical protein [Nitrospira sp. CR2.1]
MDDSIGAALIGAIGLIAAAIISRESILSRLISRSDVPSIAGKWDSSWEDCDGDTPNDYCRETLVIESQCGKRVKGHILMHTQSSKDKRWDIEGRFDGRFLQIIYWPSNLADNKHFVDCGCYFFELKGDGSFKGFSIGYSWVTNMIGPSNHQLVRVTA